MKTEDEQLLKTFCAGKVIKYVEFPAPHTLRILFETGDAGIEISEPKAEAKGLVVRMIHQQDPTTQG